jgi:hypothetical protein
MSPEVSNLSHAFREVRVLRHGMTGIQAGERVERDGQWFRAVRVQIRMADTGDEETLGASWFYGDYIETVEYHPIEPAATSAAIQRDDARSD